jgi:hypothetical protein
LPDWETCNYVAGLPVEVLDVIALKSVDVQLVPKDIRVVVGCWDA